MSPTLPFIFPVPCYGPLTAFEARFAAQTLRFMLNATRLYAKPDIHFFLNSGPMENTVRCLPAAAARGGGAAATAAAAAASAAAVTAAAAADLARRSRR